MSLELITLPVDASVEVCVPSQTLITLEGVEEYFPSFQQPEDY